MKSSAVKARISETVDEMRRPVAMYGTELGSVIRERRSSHPTPNERAVSTASGSTSRTPYIVWTRSGQNAPKVARKTSLLRFVPSVRKSTGMSAAEGIGRRNSMGTRNALAAKSLEPSRMPIGTARAVAMPSPSAQPRTVSANDHQKWLVCIIRHSSSKLVLIAGRSRCEMAPVREITSQKASADAIETTKTTGSASDMRRSRATATGGPVVATSPAAISHLSEADVVRDLFGGPLERRGELVQELVHRHERPVHGDVDRGHDVTGLRPHRRGDRAQTVGELLVVDREPLLPHALELL